MPKFDVLKFYMRSDGVFYEPGHPVELERSDVIADLPDDLLAKFDEVFKPADLIAQAFRETVVADHLTARGIP